MLLKLHPENSSLGVGIVKLKISPKSLFPKQLWLNEATSEGKKQVSQGWQTDEKARERTLAPSCQAGALFRVLSSLSHMIQHLI